MTRDSRDAGARDLRERLSCVEPAELAALERVWEGLELPEPAPPPPGFARRIAARAAGERSGAAAWPQLRWAGAAALALGIAMGGLLAAGLVESETAAETVAAESEGDELYAEASLAESYLDAAVDPAAVESAAAAGDAARGGS